MSFLRAKPIRKTSAKTNRLVTYRYIYEVESYKKAGKVKQKSVRFLGKYILLKRVSNKKFPPETVQKFSSKEDFFKELFAFNLINYGFKKVKQSIFRRGDITADFTSARVFDRRSGKNVYLNINNKFFGTETLKNVLNLRSRNLFDFTKAISDSGLINPEREISLLQAISKKFGNFEGVKTKEMDFEEFTNKIGY